MYMALHIADEEVSELMNQYAELTGMSKTESLRRLLKTALGQTDGSVGGLVDVITNRILDKVNGRLMDVKEAAVYLGLGQMMIRQMAASGELRPIRIGKLVKFTAGELDRFIDALKAKGTVK